MRFKSFSKNIGFHLEPNFYDIFQVNNVTTLTKPCVQEPSQAQDLCQESPPYESTMEHSTQRVKNEDINI